MIDMVSQEYAEDNLAVRTIVITFFHIPIFKFRKTSTNCMTIRQLTPIKKRTQLKGFNYETENKSKSID